MSSILSEEAKLGMMAFMFLVVSQHKIILSYKLVGALSVGGRQVGCNGNKVVKK